jgi:ferredoxin
MEFTELQKWRDKLNVCIRCAYCYEHCHIFKVTGWETDTARGKLIMIFGMLQGNIEPSEYTAEKIFECYNCKRCDNTCSAKVPVTDIFSDAKTDILNAGFDPEGTVAKINDDLCCRCRVCISVCKHEARTYDKENDKIVIDKVKCESCGSCVSACPSGAAYSREGFGLSQRELSEQVVNFLGEAL